MPDYRGVRRDGSVEAGPLNFTYFPQISTFYYAAAILSQSGADGRWKEPGAIIEWGTRCRIGQGGR